MGLLVVTSRIFPSFCGCCELAGPFVRLWPSPVLLVADERSGPGKSAPPPTCAPSPLNRAPGARNCHPSGRCFQLSPPTDAALTGAAVLFWNTGMSRGSCRLGIGENSGFCYRAGWSTPPLSVPKPAATVALHRGPLLAGWSCFRWLYIHTVVERQRAEPRWWRENWASCQKVARRICGRSESIMGTNSTSLQLFCALWDEAQILTDAICYCTFALIIALHKCIFLSPPGHLRAL